MLFLTGSLLMLSLLVQRQHFENHCRRDIYLEASFKQRRLPRKTKLRFTSRKEVINLL